MKKRRIRRRMKRNECRSVEINNRKMSEINAMKKRWEKEIGK